MQLNTVLRKSGPGLVAVLACGLALLQYFHLDQQEALRKATDTYVKSDIRPRLQERGQAIDQYFRHIHESTRLIAGLGSVRALEGANRPDPSMDVRQSSRISDSDFDTLKALYENLAASTRLSELYITLKGFDDQVGDVPLIMFDSAITGEKRERLARSEESLDTPPQDESAEYAYVADTLRALEAIQPINQRPESSISAPFLVSAPMRTCDNSQYTSLKNGNVRDAMGILLSTPFYALNSGELRGLVTAILRLNVLEALITGAPMVMVTDEDRTIARTRGWVAPPVSSMVLQNDSGSITVFDRRNPTVVADVRHGEPGTHVFTWPINAPDGSVWRLSYFLTRAEKAAIADEVARIYRLPLVATISLTLFSMGMVLLFFYYRMANQRLGETLSSVREAKEQLQHRSNELVATQQKLVASEKKAALGVFTAGIAHEINNPANFASVGAQNAEVQINDLRSFIAELLHTETDGELRDAFGVRFQKIDMSLNAVRSGITRIERVVKSLRASNPEGDGSIEPCPVIDLLESAWQVVAPSLKAPITIRKQLYARPVIDCRVGDIHQTFMALLTNAGHAIEDSLTSRNQDVNGEITLESWEEGDTLCIAVTDNGCGIGHAIRERIFDPFFTTKPVGRGSGLGLSTARAVLQSHGGSLTLDHARDTGARFLIRLPLHQADGQ